MFAPFYFSRCQKPAQQLTSVCRLRSLRSLRPNLGFPSHNPPHPTAKVRQPEERYKPFARLAPKNKGNKRRVTRPQNTERFKDSPIWLHRRAQPHQAGKPARPAASLSVWTFVQPEAHNSRVDRLRFATHKWLVTFLFPHSKTTEYLS